MKFYYILIAIFLFASCKSSSSRSRAKNLNQDTVNSTETAECQEMDDLNPNETFAYTSKKNSEAPKAELNLGGDPSRYFCGDIVYSGSCEDAQESISYKTSCSGLNSGCVMGWESTVYRCRLFKKTECRCGRNPY